MVDNISTITPNSIPLHILHGTITSNGNVNVSIPNNISAGTYSCILKYIQNDIYQGNSIATTLTINKLKLASFGVKTINLYARTDTNFDLIMTLNNFRNNLNQTCTGLRVTIIQKLNGKTIKNSDGVVNSVDTTIGTNGEISFINSFQSTFKAVNKANKISTVCSTYNTDTYASTRVNVDVDNKFPVKKPLWYDKNYWNTRNNADVVFGEDYVSIYQLSIFDKADFKFLNGVQFDINIPEAEVNIGIYNPASSKYIRLVNEGSQITGKTNKAYVENQVTNEKITVKRFFKIGVQTMKMWYGVNSNTLNWTFMGSHDSEVTYQIPIDSTQDISQYYFYVWDKAHVNTITLSNINLF